jgi:hypothetical protein
MAAASPDVGSELLAERGLPDAGLAAHHHEHPFPDAGQCKRVCQVPELILAPDEDTAVKPFVNRAVPP